MNTRSKQEIKDIVVSFRLDLYNHMVPCGGKAIRNKMRRWGVKPLPSISAIEKILQNECLTNGRTGFYPEDYGITVSKDGAYTYPPVFWDTLVEYYENYEKEQNRKKRTLIEAQGCVRKRRVNTNVS
jgi:hypothetical protein